MKVGLTGPFQVYPIPGDDGRLLPGQRRPTAPGQQAETREGETALDEAASVLTKAWGGESTHEILRKLAISIREIRVDLEARGRSLPARPRSRRPASRAHERRAAPARYALVARHA